MTFDICPACDGTGERCILSGAKCYECNGTGVLEDEDYDSEGHGYDCDCVECTFEAAASECGLLPDHLGGGCTMAGTEFCDFDCPMRRFEEEAE